MVKLVVDLAVLEMSVKRNLERAVLFKQNKQYRERLELNNVELKEHIDRLQLDMQAGRLVQQKMLPHGLVIKEPLVFEHYMLPSMYLSGDFVDYFELQDGLFFFYIMDVSGHGASSAMITVLVKSVINRFVENSLSELAIHPEFDLQALLETINLELLKSETGKHATMFVGTINLYQNCLQYINAAHYPRPILKNFNSYTEIETEGLAVGLFDDAQYSLKTLEIGDDFELTMCSDGLFEVLPQKKLQQKEQVLLEIIQKQHNTIDDLAHNLALPCEQEVPDDVTLLRVKKVK